MFIFEYEVCDNKGKSLICQVQAENSADASEILINCGWIVGDMKRILIDPTNTHVQSMPKVQMVSVNAKAPSYVFLSILSSIFRITGILAILLFIFLLVFYILFWFFIFIEK